MSFLLDETFLYQHNTLHQDAPLEIIVFTLYKAVSTDIRVLCSRHQMKKSRSRIELMSYQKTTEVDSLK